MARKGNKKKKAKKNKQKVKKNYTQREFTEVFCQTCLICEDKPIFCYRYLYKHEPKAFINKVFNHLVETHAIYQSMGKSIRMFSIEQFENTVCRTGICFNGDVYAPADCDQRETCYLEFMRQMGIEKPKIQREIMLTELIEFETPKRRFVAFNKKKKKQKRYVCKPYATFFSRDNEEFQAAIKRILYGDNYLEQNKDQELSSSDTGATGGDAEGGEPEVHGGSSKG
jgi:hypothetical protein